MLNRRIRLAAAGLALVLLAGAAARTGDAPEGEAHLAAVSVDSVRTIETSEPTTYVGTVAGAEEVDVVARVSGTLWKVAFTEGATVGKGDVLFEIEDTVYKANVRVAEALIKQAEANLQLAAKDHERNTSLLREKAISTQTFDTTLAAQLLEEARVEEARANLVLKRHDLEYTRIVSPITGRIGETRYSEGNYITPGLGVLATVVQYQPIEVKFSLSESDYFRHFQNHDRLNGVRLSVVRANGLDYDGASRVKFVDNKVDSRTDTITVTLECDNPGDQLLPGGFVQVRLAERYRRPLAAAPVSAFMTDGRGHYVYVVGENDVVQRRDVETGDVVGGLQAVTGGLQTGDRVIVGGMNKTAPGERVRPIPVR